MDSTNGIYGSEAAARLESLTEDMAFARERMLEAVDGMRYATCEDVYVLREAIQDIDGRIAEAGA